MLYCPVCGRTLWTHKEIPTRISAVWCRECRKLVDIEDLTPNKKERPEDKEDKGGSSIRYGVIG